MSEEFWVPQNPVTRSEIAAGVQNLGVEQGDIVMFHTSMKALGWVVGGADTVVEALLDAVGPNGTLMAVCGWHGDTYEGFDTWPEETQRAYLEEMPAFDPTVSESVYDVGRLPERLRTWPGARRSANPETSFCAVGARADWLIDPHPVDFGFGEGTPLARLVEAEGKVLMLGAPLETITLLHHAETLATAPGKRFVEYDMPILVDGQRVWQHFRDIDSSDRGAYDYAPITGDTDAFEVMGREALDAGVGSSGPVGLSTSHLFSAHELVGFALAWIDRHFRA